MKCLLRPLVLIGVFFSICLIPAVAQNSKPTTPSGDLVTEIEEWKRFSPSAMGFSVLLPSRPTVTDQTIENPTGNIINHVYYSEFRSDVFMVTVAKFPEPISDKDRIKLMLDNGRDNGLSGSKAQLKSEKEITLDGNYGREWEMVLPKSIRARSRAYWVTDTLYQLIALVPEVQTPQIAKESDVRVFKFLESFELKRKVAE